MIFIRKLLKFTQNKELDDVPAPDTVGIRELKMTTFKVVGAFNFAIILIILGGCRQPISADIPEAQPAGRFYVEYKPIAANDECDCTNSQAAYLYNTYDVAKRITVRVETKDISSGVNLETINSPVTIPAKTEGGEAGVFLNCTVHAPSTNCRFQANYKVGGWFTEREIPTELRATYGSDSVPSLASCVAWCSDPDHPNAGACLERGVRDFKVIAPIREAVLASQSGTANGVIPVSQLLAKYGLQPTDDSCSRGDTVVRDGKIVNEGLPVPDGKTCIVRGSDYPSQVLAALGLQQLSSGTGMGAVIPTRIEASFIPSIKFLNSNHGVAFLDSTMSPRIFFDGIGHAQLNSSFGGEVLASAQISAPGRRKQTVVATVNGCIAVDEP